MKNLIFGVVALLCIQAMHAANPSDNDRCKPKQDQCKVKLFTFRQNTEEFFETFGAEHDIAHKDLVEIQEICENLTSALDYYSAADYGVNLDLNGLQCDIKTFFDAFEVARTNSLDLIQHLEGECDVLLAVAGKYAATNDLTCEDARFKNGCEADLNSDRCDLRAFFDGLKEQRENALVYLNGLEDSCYILGDAVNNFSATYDLTCNDSGIQDNKADQSLLDDYKIFLADFTAKHDIVHERLVQLSAICDSLSEAITTMTARF